MKLLRIKSLILLILLLSGCTNKSTGVGPLQENPAPIPSPVDDEIREAVFRYQIDSTLSILNDVSVIVLANVEVDSLGFFKRYVDPSDELIDRIKVDKLKVKKFSLCHYNGAFYYDNDSTHWGILFFLYPLQYPTISGIKVEGGYYEFPDGAAGAIFFLHKASRGWVLDSLKGTWIS